MEAAKLNKLDKERWTEIDMIGSGKHWEGKLTIPEAP